MVRVPNRRAYGILFRVELWVTRDPQKSANLSASSSLASEESNDSFLNKHVSQACNTI